MKDDLLHIDKKLDEYQKETRENFSKVFEDKQDIIDKYDDLYREVSKLKTEFELFKNEIQKHTKTVKKEHNETREIMADSVEAIEENVTGNTKVIIKEVDKKTLIWWQFWKKGG